MSKTEQMREALRLLQEIHPGNMTPMAEESWKNATGFLEQALAAEYTPPTEKYTPPEPAKLVRLTHAEITDLGDICGWTITPSLRVFINTIIDAMECKNAPPQA